jgi:hypothetical protein
MAKKRSRSRSASGDLFASVNQTAMDKLFGSVGYPLRVVDERKDFPGCDRGNFRKTWPVTEYSTDDIGAMFRKAVQKKDNKEHDPETAFNHRILSFGGSIIEQAKKALDAAESEDYEGPSKASLRAVVDGGVQALPATIKPLGDWGLYAHLSHFAVIVNRRPALHLASPRISLNGVSITVEATGELWAKFPWWNCYKWCFQWEKVIKCERAASISVSLDILAEAHALIESSGAVVTARAEFDRLRLDYPILRDIPLEGIANSLLSDKLVSVVDVSKLVAVVPVLESKFTIGEVLLPASADSIDVGVNLRQI